MMQANKTTNLIEIIDNVSDEKTQTQLLRALANTNGMGLMRACLRFCEEQAVLIAGEQSIDRFNETQGGNHTTDALNKNRTGFKDLGKDGGYTRDDTHADAAEDPEADNGHTARRTTMEIAKDFALMYLAAADKLRARKLTEFDHPMDLPMMFDFAVRTMASNNALQNVAIAAALGTTVDITRKANAESAKREEHLRTLKESTIALFHNIVGDIDEPSWEPLYSMRPDTMYNLLVKLADAMIKERIRLLNNSGNCLHLFAPDAFIKADVAHQLMLEGERYILANKNEVAGLLAQGATRLNTLTKSYWVTVDRRTGEKAEYSCQQEYDGYLAYLAKQAEEKKAA